MARLQIGAIFVLACLLMIVPGPGMAQERFVHCQLSTVTDADFGELDLSLDREAPFRTTAYLNIRCNQGEPNETIYVCLHLGSGTGGGNAGVRLMDGPNPDRPLLYNIYEDEDFRGGGSVWGGNLGGFGDGPPLFTLILNEQGSIEQIEELQLHFEVWRPRRQISLPTGEYASTFRTNTHSRMEYGYDSGNNCNDPLDFGRTGTGNDDFRALNTGFEVTATVVAPTEVFGFSKAFAPDRVPQGGISRLTFTIDSSANLFDLRELNFTDNFPDGMVVAPEPDASTTCTGGTVSATVGGTTVGFSGGSVAEGETCTVAVNVQALRAGTLENLSGGLGADFIPGATGGAEATLTVVTPDPPGFAKAFSPDTIRQGGETEIVLRVDNGANAIGITEMAFDDTLPSGVSVADTPGITNTCGGSFSPVAGATTLAFADGALAAGATCEIRVTVRAIEAGTLTGPEVALRSSIPTATAAPATLTVTPADAPGFARVFAPDTIAQGGETEIVLRVDNGANAIGITEMAFDDTLPLGVSVADVPGITNGCGGTFSPVAGATTLAFADGALAAGATCEIRVTVRAIAAGTLTGPAVDLTSSIATATAAEATLTVTAADAPGFAKAFLPDTVDPGGVSTLTFTIGNGANLIEVGSLAFTDAFPGGLAVAATPNGSTTCGGTFAPVASATALAFTGGSVAAGETCTIAVDVQALRVGTLENLSGALTSDLPVTTPGAGATLTVDEAPLSVGVAFAPTAIAQGGISTLRYTLRNGAAIGATEVALSDTLPADVVLAGVPNAETTCTGGRLTAAAGGSEILYSDGTLAAGADCTIAVDVTSAAVGSYRNPTESVTSSLGTSTPAEATLMVDPAAAPGFARVFAPDTIRQGGETEIVLRVDNGANAIGITGMAFDDTLPSGVSVADTPGAGNNCGGTFSPVAGATTLAFADGALAAGATCEIRVTVRAIAAGTLTGPAVDLTSSIATATAAEATLTVEPAVAPGFAKAFSPARVAPGGVSTLTFTIGNGANLIEVGSLAFTDAFPDGMTVAATPNGSTTCGGTFAPVASATALAFSGGSVAAGETCTIAVDVQALRVGTLENLSGALTSDLPVTTPGAGATLTVDEAPLSVGVAFDPTAIAQGGISTLRYTLRNGAAIGATEVALSDTLPANVVLAGVPNAETTCAGGTLTAAAGGGDVSYSGGSLAAGAACTIAVAVTSAAVGSYPNPTERVTSSLGTSTPASATLTVDPAAAPGFARVFAPDTIRQGGETEIVLRVDNGANAIGITEMAFDDTLPSGVSVADTPGAGNSCGGTFSPVAGATTLAFADGALAAGATCEIRVTVRATEAGTLTGPAVDLTSSIATATAAEATLTVTAADAPGFAKAFSPDTVDPGGVSTLTFTIGNGANLIEVGSLAFTDAFPDGMTVAATPNGSTTCGGTFAPVASATALAFSGGSVAAGASCTLSVDVRALRAGTLENLSGALTSDLPVTTPGARATLTVDEAPLSVGVAFAPTAIAQGGISTLRYTLRNGAAIGATEVALSDTLPADVVLAGVPNAETTCAGGTLTAAAGGGDVSYSGGSLAAGAACTIAVDVTSAVAGSYPNPTESVTSSLGTSTPASATLTVDPAAAPGFARVFAPDTIRQGGETEIVLRVDNGANAIGITEMAFDDSLPSGVSVADTPGAGNSCGGTFSPVAGATGLSFADGVLAAGARCEIRVTVRATEAGTLTGPAVDLTSSIATATAAPATLTVTAADAPGFAKAFSPARVAPGGVSTLTFTIGNGANLIEVGSLAFTDAFPDGMTVAATPNGSTTCGGTFAPVASATALAFSGGSVAAGETCTLSVDVRALRAGTLENLSGALTSDLPVTTPVAGATLTVDEAPLSVGVAFAPTAIAQGGISTLRYTLRNGAAVGATEVALSDTLPADVVLAGVPNAETSCGGTLTAAAGGGDVSYSGGSLAAGAACMIAVDVTSAVAGSYPNETQSVTSSLGTSTPASATLTVDPAAAPGFARVFAPDTIRQGGETQIVLRVDNGANAIGITEMAFDDTLPSGVSVADTPGAGNSCGGTFSPVAGATTLAFADGALAAGATCEIRVTVRAIAAGTLIGPAVALTSSIATATAAPATLTVEPAVAPGFAKAFSPARVDPGEIFRLTFTINNTATLIDVGGLAFDDVFPTGLVVAAASNVDNSCGGTVSATAGGDRVSLSGGAVAANASCTIAVDVRALRAGTLENLSGALTSDLPVTTPGAGATLTVDEAPLSVGVAFAPTAIAQGGISTLRYTLRNGAAVGATEVALSDTLPADVVLAGVPNAETTCAGGTLTAAAGGGDVSYSGGALAAGAACTIAVDVTSAVAGSYPNPTERVTSSLGTSTPASATLTVEPAVAPGFAKAFSPARVVPGGVSTLTFTIGNGANLIEVGSLAFTDAFPDGMTVAAAPNASTTCTGGTVSAPAGGDRVSLSGGTVAADTICTLSVDVQALRAGTLENLSGALTSDLPVTTPGAGATLTVDEAPLSVGVAFAPTAIAQGGISTLRYTLRNGAAVGATEVALSDRLPADVVLAGVPNAETTCAGGTLTAAAGGGDVSYSGGSLAAGAACTIAVDVTSATVGSYRNETQSVTSSLGTSTPAEATLMVDPAAAPGFARVFAPDTIRQGGETQIVLRVDNRANAIGITEMAFDDSLPLGVSVADVPGITNGCGGTFSPVAGATTLAFADGALAAGATCEIRVTVRAIAAGTLTGPAVDLTSSIATATAAPATLTVTAADAPGFAKAFSPARVAPGGVSTLTFTIGNGANLIEVGSLAFTDAFPDGMTVAATPNGSTTCGGTFAPVASATALAFSGGSVAAGETCTLSVDVRALRAGTLENLSGALTSDLPVTTPGAGATLTVDEAPLSVGVAFAPTAIAQGGISTLRYTLRNGAAVGATEVALSDTLPADVVLAGVPNAETTCTGGTLTAAAGGGDVSYSGGSLAAGAACTIAVDVTSAVAGSYPNPTERVTSSLGTSTPASATLTVDPAAAPGFARVFAPDTIAQGGETEIVLRVDNGANAIGITGMAFDDTLPSGVSVADTPGAGNSCGGTFSPVAGATTLAFADGALAAGATCEIRVTVRATEAGTLIGPAVALTSSIATATAAPATLTVTPADAPGFAKAFSPARVAPGGVSTLTFTIGNGANLIEVGSLAFTDAFPDGMTVAATPNGSTTCGGTFAPVASATALAFSGGSVAAGETCTIAVDVQALRVGTLENLSGALTSDLPVTTPGAGATLTVDEAPLSVGVAFDPTAIAQGGISTLRYTLRNGAAIGATEVALSDTLPANVVLAGVPNAETTCAGGTLTAAAGGGDVSYSGGSLAAGAACTIAVDVTSATVGSYRNPTESVTSSLGTSTPAEATLMVDPAAAPGFARVFAPDTIRQGGETEIVLRVDNGANAIGITGMAFDDTLPSGVSVADTPGAGNSCGGTFSPVAGATTLAFADGALAAGATCEIRVTVRAIAAGTLTGPAVDLTSSIATATAAEATLTVEPAVAPGFAKAFSPARVAPGGVSTLTFTIGNGANLIEVGSLAFTDAFPDGMTVAATPNGSTTCGGTFAPVASATALAFSGGSVAAGETCTIAVDVQALRVGTLENLSGALTSDLPVTTPGAGATLTVDEAPLSVGVAFAPTAIAQGGISTLRYILRNGAAIGATEVALSDTLPADVVLAGVPNAETTCAGGTLTAAAGGGDVSYSGGSLAAGAACTIAVDVTSAVAGSYPNPTQSVTSSLGTSAAAQATLMVDPAAAPGFARVFAPDTIRQGGETQIVLRVDNGANAIGITEMAFDDTLPSGVSVADTPGITNTCGGTFSPVAGATTLAFADGVLAAGARCEIRVTVRAIAAGTLTGPAVALTSSIATATAATATLTVTPADAPGFAKAFSPARVAPGGVSTLTFTIDNGANLIEVGSLAFTDAFPDGMTVAGTPNASTTCGGTFAPAASVTSLVFSGGRVAAGASCTLSVDVRALRAGTLENLSGALTSDLPVTTPGAGATLTVDEAPLSVGVAFAPTAIAQGGISTLRYTLRNGAAVGATEVALSDTLPADVVLAGVPNAETTCTGGTLTAAAGGGDVSYSGGALAAGAACTIAVDVTSAVAGSYPNETQSVTSSLGTSAAAQATLTVNAAAAPGFARVFAPDTIRQGGETEIVLRVDNGANAIGITGMAFDDTLPSGVSVAETPGAGNSCGGTFSPVAGATGLSFADGVLAAGATCEIRVTVRAIAAGTLVGPAVALRSSIATATAAEATLTVTAADAPGFAKAFSPARVAPGGVSTLTFTIGNGANLIEVGSLAFTDAFPDGMTVAATPNGSTTCGGTFAPVASATELAFTGGSVAAGETCTLSVDVRALRAGALENLSGALTSDLPVTTPGAGATLTVDEAPLSVGVAFAPTAIAQGGISTLRYTLRNGAAVGATEVALSDTLPADVVLAGVPNAETSCGGTLTAAAGGGDVSYSGGSLAAGAACTIAVDVTSAAVGSYPNPTESVTSSLGTSAAAQATLTVNPAAAPGFARVFAPDTIRQGGETEIVLRVDNGANAIGITEMAFDDSLPSGVSVADTPGAGNSCGGTFSPVAGATTLAFADGALAAGATCEIRVTVRATEAGTLTGPAVDLTSSIATATAAEATLTVTAADAPGFAKAFSPARVDPGEIFRLTFTINNTATLIDVGSLAFTDAFPDGMTVAATPNGSTTCGGTFAPVASATALAFSGGSVAAGASCTLSVDVRALRAGTLENLSGALTSDLPVTTPGAGATLTVDEAPLSVGVAFAPTAIAQGGISTLRYTLRNGAAIGATEVALSDRLPADVVLAGVPNAETTCAGGRLTAAAGGSEILYSDGTLAAGADCTIAVDVTSAAVGSYRNPTESVTSSLGTSTPAEATLMVDPAAAPGFARVFAPDTIRQGGETEIVLRVDNGANAIGITGMAFDDTLPSGVSVADTPGAGNNCGGTFSPVAGATTLAFADGALAAGATCEIRVTVRAIAAGTLTGPAVDLTSSIATATAAEATLTVEPAVAPGFAKAFSPARVAPGGVSTLTFTIGNGANLIEVGSLAFTDAFPDGMTVAATPNGSTTCGGTFAPVASATALAFSGGSVAAGETCTLSVDVRALRAGTLENLSGALTSDLPVTTPGAGATLTVDEAPLSVGVAFDPTAIAQGGISTLRYTLRNGAAIGATEVALSDRLPADVVLAGVPNAETTCAGGTLTAAAGGGDVSYSGGSLAAGAACTIAVDVTSAVAGSYPNPTESVTSSLGTSTPASATLTVDPAAAPGFARVFAPDTIRQGGETEIVLRVDNGANAIGITEMAFDDSLPSGVSVADTPGAGNSCGGTFSPVAGATGLAFADGVLAAGARCEIRVTVRATEAGTLTGPAVDLTSSIATATAAPATLTVTAADAPGFAKAFSPARVAPGGVSTLTFTIGNGANLIEVGSLAFTDAFPDGMTVAATPNGSTTCGGTFAPVASATALAFSGGSVAAGETCTLSVDVRALRAGTLENLSGALTSDLPVTTPGAGATLTVDEAPLSVGVAFAPTAIAQGGISTLRYTLRNGAAVGATEVALSDTLPADVVLAGVPNAETSCGGTLTAAAGGGDVSYSGGSLAAGAACMIAVDVTSAVAGSYPNETQSVTSSLGTSTPASATLTVDPAAAPGFARVFAPDTIRQGGETQIVLRVDNGANAIGITEMAFDDTLPSGVSVADTPGAGNSCGGTFSPVAGATTLAFADGVLAAGARCEIRVTVRAIAAGTLTGPAVALTSSIATATAATATLTVEPAVAPGFAKAFSPARVDPGEIFRLTFTINNTATLIDVGGLAFDDVFPTGLVVAAASNVDNSCGGTVSATAGGDRVSLSGGAVAANASCTLAVDVRALRAGPLENTSDRLTSDLPVTTPPASATLSVDEAPLSVDVAFAPTAIAQGDVSTLRYTLGNGAVVAATEVALSATLPANLVLAADPDASTSCGGTLTAAAGGDTITFTGGALAAGAACTIAVDVTSAAVGSYPNPTERVTSSLGTSTPAEAPPRRR